MQTITTIIVRIQSTLLCDFCQMRIPPSMGLLLINIETIWNLDLDLNSPSIPIESINTHTFIFTEDLHHSNL